jgi:hypothetical protein
LAALGLLGVVLALPIAAWQQGAVTLAVLAWATRSFVAVALRRGPRAVTELRLAPDLVLVVHHGDGRLVAGTCAMPPRGELRPASRRPDDACVRTRFRAGHAAGRRLPAAARGARQVQQGAPASHA